METKIVSTTCVLDCPDTCALKVTVENNKVTALTGSKGHPFTDGIICSKVGRFARRLYHEDRILYPQRRTGPKGSGQFMRISWEEAISDITYRFGALKSKRGSGEAILPYYYGGSNGFLSQGLADAFYFRNLGASQLDTTICAAPTGLAAQALYGRMPGVSYEDLVHSKFILLWGTNPRATSIHLASILAQAKKNGAFIAVIDPVNHFSEQAIDLHLPIRPGTDVILAMALIGYWDHRRWLDTDFIAKHTVGFETLRAKARVWDIDRASEVCGLSIPDVLRLAETYVNSSPALLRCGWGQERNRNGCQASAAIMAIPAVLGKFGVRGGGLLMSNSRATSYDSSSLGVPPATTRKINMTQLAEALEGRLDPPIEALFVYNSNPVATTPGQTRLIKELSRESLFCVVSEQVMTDTALYADILLPATTFLETQDIRRGYGAYVVGGVQPVVPPQGEAISNHELFCALAKRMGYDDALFDWSLDDVFERTAEAIRLAGGGTPNLKRLRAGETVRAYKPGKEPIQFKNVFPNTPDRKVHFDDPRLGPDPYTYKHLNVPRHHLMLISPASGKMITSTFGEFNYPSLVAMVHPDDAKDRKIVDGGKIRIYNEQGEVHCRVEVSEKIAKGVVCLPKGAWRKSSLNGFTSTALCPTSIEPQSGGACFNDARVEMAPLPD